METNFFVALAEGARYEGRVCWSGTPSDLTRPSRTVTWWGVGG